MAAHAERRKGRRELGDQVQRQTSRTGFNNKREVENRI